MPKTTYVVPDGEQCMSPHDVSAYTTLAYSTLANLRTQKAGPRFYRIGGRVVYRRSDVDAWINAGSDAQ